MTPPTPPDRGSEGSPRRPGTGREASPPQGQPGAALGRSGAASGEPGAARARSGAASGEPGSAREAVVADPDLLSGRLFFAVPLPSPTKAPIEALLPEISRSIPDARIAAAAGWHLTLAFLGQVRPESAADVVKVGETAVAGLSPARLRLEGAGGFPSTRRARVLWAGIAGDVDVLASLAMTLAAESRRAGLRFEERELHPHLTLARLQRPALLPEPIVERIAEAAASSPPWRARELCCYRSTLTRGGARYQVVRSFPLAG
jgi:RNA 2',3'-cyclic 3'-phosphodiesterase